MPKLDDAAMYARLDPSNMRDLMGALPAQCSQAWELSKDLELPSAYSDVRQVIVTGMGGSAIGGALLSALVADTCPLPIILVGGYDLPAYVGPDTLVVASSYSGNTEETLATFAQAQERGCRIVAVTTGGKLSADATAAGLPVLHFPHGAAPRAALGFSFTLLLGLLCHLGLLQNYERDLHEAVTVLQEWQRELTPDVETSRNPAKQLALRLVNRLPVVYGAGFLAPVARRWKGQFNENSKNWSFWEELPELDHNAVVGCSFPAGVREQVTVLFVRSRLDHPRVQSRWDVTGEVLEREHVATETAWGRGESRLAHMLSLVHLGDYTSLYLTMLNGTDPSPVPPIDFLKQRLAEM